MFKLLLLLLLLFLLLLFLEKHFQHIKLPSTNVDIFALRCHNGTFLKYFILVHTYSMYIPVSLKKLGSFVTFWVPFYSLLFSCHVSIPYLSFSIHYAYYVGLFHSIHIYTKPFVDIFLPKYLYLLYITYMDKYGVWERNKLRILFSLNFLFKYEVILFLYYYLLDISFSFLLLFFYFIFLHISISWHKDKNTHMILI